MSDEKLVAIVEYSCLGDPRYIYDYWYIVNNLLGCNTFNTTYIKKTCNGDIIDLKRNFENIKSYTENCHGRLITNQKDIDKHLMLQELMR